MPRQKRHVLFGPGEMTRAILDVIRDATEPLPTGEFARSILAMNEQDPRELQIDDRPFREGFDIFVHF
jgi:hypothetical protein